MEDLVERMQELFARITNRSADLRFDKENPQQLYSICLFGSILESMSGCVSLLRSGDYSAIPGVLRSLIEAYVDLLNLVRNPNHIYTMHATHLMEQVNSLRAAIADGGANAYFAELNTTVGLKGRLAEIEKEQSELKGQGYLPLKKAEAFRAAGLAGMYPTVYSDLCRHSHNNLSVLERRHLAEDGGKCTVRFFKKWDKDDIVPYIDTVCGATVDALINLGRVANFHGSANHPDVIYALARLRTTY